MNPKAMLFLTLSLLVSANQPAFTAPAVDLRSEITKRGIAGRHQAQRNTCVLHSMTFLQEYALTGIFGSLYNDLYNDLSEEFMIQAGNRATGEQGESSSFRKFNMGYNSYGTISDSLWRFISSAVYNYDTWNATFDGWINTGINAFLQQDGYKLAGKCLREGNEGAVTSAQIDKIIEYLDRGIPVALANAGHSTALIGYEKTSSRSGGGYFIYRDSYSDHPFGEYNFGDIKAANQNYAFFVYEIAQAFPTVYEHANFGGASIALVPARYTTSQLQNTGISNDCISSIKIPSGYTVYLYPNDNFSGTAKVLSSTESDLTTINFNDVVSSIIILKSSSAMESPCARVDNSPVGSTSIIPETLAPKMSKNFTIEMWVNPGSVQETYANIVDFNHRANVGMVIQQNGSSTNNFVFGIGNNSTSSGLTYQLQAGAWQHIAFERNGTTLSLYVNGRLAIWQSCFPEDIYFLPNSATTVQYNANYGRYFNGAIKGLKFWNYAKSSTSLLAESMYRTSFDFNGSTDGINMGNALPARMTRNFSVEMKVTPGSTQQTYANILDLNHRGNIGFVIQQNGNTTNNYCFGVGNGSTTSAISYQLTVGVSQMIKFERTGTTIRLYVNGNQVATQTCFADDIYLLPNSNATLGYNSNYGRYFNGNITNLKFNFY